MLLKGGRHGAPHSLGCGVYGIARQGPGGVVAEPADMLQGSLVHAGSPLANGDHTEPRPCRDGSIVGCWRIVVPFGPDLPPVPCDAQRLQVGHRLSHLAAIACERFWRPGLLSECGVEEQPAAGLEQLARVFDGLLLLPRLKVVDPIPPKDDVQRLTGETHGFYGVTDQRDRRRECAQAGGHSWEMLASCPGGCG